MAKKLFIVIFKIILNVIFLLSFGFFYQIPFFYELMQQTE